MRGSRKIESAVVDAPEVELEDEADGAPDSINHMERKSSSL